MSNDKLQELFEHHVRGIDVNKSVSNDYTNPVVAQQYKMFCLGVKIGLQNQYVEGRR